MNELFALMKAHPELPIIPLVDGEVCGDDNCALYIASFDKVEIGEYAIYGERWCEDREEFKEIYFGYNDDWLCKKFHYDPRINEFTIKSGKYTQEQLDENDKREKQMDEYLDQIAEQKFKKAIFVYICKSELEDNESRTY